MGKLEDAMRDPFAYWLNNAASDDYRVILDDYYLGLMEEAFWAGAELELIRREMGTSGEED